MALATVERVLQLYRERYFDLNLRYFHEKLGSEHQIKLSYSWVKGVWQGAGLVTRGLRMGQDLMLLWVFLIREYSIAWLKWGVTSNRIERQRARKDRKEKPKNAPEAEESGV